MLLHKLYLILMLLPCVHSPVYALAGGKDGASAQKSSELEAITVRSLASYGRLPVAFEANPCQDGTGAEFKARGRNYAMLLDRTGATLALRGDAASDTAVVRMNLIGASGGAKGEAFSPLPGKANYFLGNDPSRWRTGIPTFARVRYRSVYPGIDIVYYGNQEGRLEYDFNLSSGADPDRIELEFSGIQAARLDQGGDLLLSVAGAELRLHRPLMYQAASGRNRPVEGRYRLLSSNRVRFEVLSYDKTKPLVIDPVLTYSALIGGSGWEFADYNGKGLAVDGSGNVYVTGSTWSNDFPIPAGVPPATAASAGAPDAFVAKLSPDGGSLLYSTYFGGRGADWGIAAAVDAAGTRLVFGGYTNSADFPTNRPYQANYGGGDDAFVAALDSTGKLVYSTYLGGPARDQVLSVAVASTGTAYVAGRTNSGRAFPATLSLGTASGGTDGFAASFDANGALLFSGLLGGSGEDEARSVAAFGGAAYVTGVTCQKGSTPADFPVKNAFNAHGRNCDAFVTKLSGGGTMLWSTFLGGTGMDEGWGIAADATGVWVVGLTYLDFPVTAGRTAAVNSNADAFLAKLRPDGSGIVYATLFGGAEDDYALSVSVDSSGNPIVAGITRSQDFPVTADAFQPKKLGASNPVFTSADGGNSWTGTVIKGLGTAFFLRQSRSNPNTVYVSDRTYLYKSADSGSTFALATMGRLPSTANELIVDPAAPATVYAATETGMFRSTDSGITWLPVGTGLPAGNINLAAVSRDGHTIYAAVGTALYAYTGGPAWTRLVSAWPAGAFVTRIVPDISAAATVYVGTDAGLFKSTNGGAAWQALNAAPCLDFSNLTADPVKPAALYAAAAGQFCRTNDGGVSWTSRPMGIAQTASALAVDPKSPSTIYAAIGDEGLYKSVDSGSTWAGITPAGAFRFDVINTLLAGSKLAAGVTTNPDIFVTRFSGSAPTISWSTYLGGPGSVDLSGLSADANNIYLLVPTSAATFPATPGAYISANAAMNDIYVLKIASSGPCRAALRPSSLPAGDAGGGAGRIRVIAGTGCSWGSISSAPWIHASAWAGAASGLGLVEFTYDPNRTSSPRTGNIVIGTQTFALTQAASGEGLPKFVISPGRLDLQAGEGSAGGQGKFAVKADSGALSFTLTVASDLNFLSASADNPATPATVTVAANAAGLAQGIYRGTVTITGAGAGNSPQFIPVTFIVNEAAIVPSIPALAFEIAQSSHPAGVSRMIDLTSPAPLSVTASAAADGGGTFLTAQLIGPTTPTSVRVNIDATGLAPGNYSGTVSVTPAGGTLLFIPVSLKILAPGTGTPLISDRGITNGASFIAAGLSPGSIASIFGANLAADVAENTDATKVPTSLGGVLVTVNGVAAPLYYVSPGQINFQVPYETAPGDAQIAVTANGAKSSALAAAAAVSPGIFLFGNGRAAALNQDYSLNLPDRPAATGDIVMVFMTGLGPTDSPVPTGMPAPLDRVVRAVLPVEATIGGQTAQVQFAGLAPGFAGLMQVNLVVPAAPSGDQPVIVSAGGVASNQALITVQAK